MTVIILSNTDGNKTPYDAWFPNAKKYHSFCPRKRTYVYSTSFLFIESFENYVDNVDVEIKAIQLSKSTISLTYYLSQEFDVVRSAKLERFYIVPVSH